MKLTKTTIYGWAAFEVEMLAKEPLTIILRADVTAEDADTWTIWDKGCRVGVSKPDADTMSDTDYKTERFGLVNKLDFAGHIYRRGTYVSTVVRDSVYWCIPSSANSGGIPALSKVVLHAGDSHTFGRMAWNVTDRVQPEQGSTMVAEKDTLIISFDRMGPHV